MPRLTRRLLVVTAALAALTLTGCVNEGMRDAGPNPGEGVEADVTGVWGDPDAESEPSLELTEGGDVTGTDGCNQMSGTYAVEGDVITFIELTMTEMACEGVDQWLADASTATIDSDTMRIRDAAGDEIGTLDRQE